MGFTQIIKFPLFVDTWCIKWLNRHIASLVASRNLRKYENAADKWAFTNEIIFL